MRPAGRTRQRERRFDRKGAVQLPSPRFPETTWGACGKASPSRTQAGPAGPAALTGARRRVHPLVSRPSCPCGLRGAGQQARPPGSQGPRGQRPPHARLPAWTWVRRAGSFPEGQGPRAGVSLLPRPACGHLIARPQLAAGEAGKCGPTRESRPCRGRAGRAGRLHERQ